jgi:hypothetical protein
MLRQVIGSPGVIGPGIADFGDNKIVARVRLNNLIAINNRAVSSHFRIVPGRKVISAKPLQGLYQVARDTLGLGHCAVSRTARVQANLGAGEYVLECHSVFLPDGNQIRIKLAVQP